MRILLSKESKLELLKGLKKEYGVKTLKELSRILKVPTNTTKQWFYSRERYIPSYLIINPDKFNILDSKVENWGRIKGGKESYKVIVKKYGYLEIKRRRINGGKVSLINNNLKAEREFKIDYLNPRVLELYGILLGDGWLSVLSYEYNAKKNMSWRIGISGNSETDKDYFLFLKELIKELFNKDVVFKYRKESKAMDIIFCHRQLILSLNKNLGFPIGQKNNLKIEGSIANDWGKTKYVIRGIFDTDGSFFFDKVKGYYYPNIEIHMKAPLLLAQVGEQLKKEGCKTTPEAIPITASCGALRLGDKINNS